jgi:hypothetical protein
MCSNLQKQTFKAKSVPQQIVPSPRGAVLYTPIVNIFSQRKFEGRRLMRFAHFLREGWLQQRF